MVFKSYQFPISYLCSGGRSVCVYTLNVYICCLFVGVLSDFCVMVFGLIFDIVPNRGASNMYSFC